MSCTTEVEVSDRPISLSKAIDYVNWDECGAISSFIGTTRDNFNGKRVVYLEYEAYSGMAEKEIVKIVDDLKSSLQVKRVYVAHRLGRVDVGEASIVITASSPHRKDSIAFVAAAIDRIKETVPIWKREFYAGESESTWKENTECVQRRQSKTPT